MTLGHLTLRTTDMQDQRPHISNRNTHPPRPPLRTYDLILLDDPVTLQNHKPGIGPPQPAPGRGTTHFRRRSEGDRPVAKPHVEHVRGTRIHVLAKPPLGDRKRRPLYRPTGHRPIRRPTDARETQPTQLHHMGSSRKV